MVVVWHIFTSSSTTLQLETLVKRIEMHTSCFFEVVRLRQLCLSPVGRWFSEHLMGNRCQPHGSKSTRVKYIGPWLNA